MCDGRDAWEEQDERDLKLGVPGSKFRVPRTSDLEPSSVSPFPPVSRGDATSQGTDGAANRYGEIRPGIENL